MNADSLFFFLSDEVKDRFVKYLIANVMTIGSICLKMFFMESNPFRQFGFFEPFEEFRSTGLLVGQGSEIMDQEGITVMSRTSKHSDLILLPKVGPQQGSCKRGRGREGATSLSKVVFNDSDLGQF